MDEGREGEIERKKDEEGEVKEGVASIALLPCGSISGHFVHMPHSICYGLHGTELTCETEGSGGEDYRLIKLTIIDYNCETLKTYKAAEDHIRQFMPKLVGLYAVINIGAMKISGLESLLQWKNITQTKTV